jgi:hypothetical protein
VGEVALRVEPLFVGHVQVQLEVIIPLSIFHLRNDLIEIGHICLVKSVVIQVHLRLAYCGL